MKKKAKRPTRRRARPKKKRPGGPGPARTPPPNPLDIEDPRLAASLADAMRMPTEAELQNVSLRDYFRGWFMKPYVLYHAQMVALTMNSEGIRMFTGLLGKAYPTVLGVKNQDDTAKSFSVTIGEGDHKVRLDYGPMGRVPGMESAAEVPA